jgi:hypothetical protein
MMNTEQLIEALTRNVQRVTPHAVVKRVGFGIAAGCMVAIACVTAVLGVRPDLQVAIHGFSFWMKWIYSASLGLCAAYTVTQLARPTPGSLRSLWFLAVPVLILLGIAIGELTGTSPANWPRMWLGRSWMICPWLVLALAAPIYAGLLWSFQKLAPARLRAAGATAGLAAGAWASAIYCLRCPEVSALFVLTWPTLGIAFAAGLGALLGPRLMRW